jgi:hypothetical protein
MACRQHPNTMLRPIRVIVARRKGRSQGRSQGCSRASCSDFRWRRPGTPPRPRLSRRSAGAPQLSVVPDGDRCAAPRRSGIFRRRNDTRGPSPRRNTPALTPLRRGSEALRSPGRRPVRSTAPIRDLSRLRLSRASPHVRKTPALTPFGRGNEVGLSVLPTRRASHTGRCGARARFDEWQACGVRPVGSALPRHLTCSPARATTRTAVRHR